MIIEPKIYQAFYTKSTPIVDYMINALKLKKSDKIFEPCGGDGVFVEAILQQNKFANIDVYELNPQSVEILNNKFSDFKNVNIRECDTLLDSELKLKSCFGGVYDKIIANPPYGAWQDYDKRIVIKKMYPNLYTKESYALFLYRCIELLKDGGILSFIIPDTFLNLHMHKALRSYILSNSQILELSLFPSSFFPGVNFGYANLSIITLKKNSNINDCIKNNFTVINGFKNVAQLSDINCKDLNKLTFNQGEVLTNPDHALLIAEDDNVIKLINESELKVGDIADCVTGFYSGNDKHFLRVRSHEVKNGKNYDLVQFKSINKTYKNHPKILDGLEEDQPFIPIVKGGNTKYHKAENWYMNWGKEAVQHYKTNRKARFQNPKYYFRFGIGVPMISSSNITASIIDEKLFDQSIVGIFPKNVDLTYYFLAFFNSPTCNKLIRTINPSANNPANYIKKIPIIIPEYSVLNVITENTKEIVKSIENSGQYDKSLELNTHKIIKDIYKF